MTLIPGIKQISQVGNDMYAQGAFPVGIGTTEVSYLADPADTRLLAGRDPVLEEISVGMSGVETEQKYSTGAQPLTVTDAMLGNLTYCQVQFSPKQDLNGYDSPWPAGGGKNKFNPADAVLGKWIDSNTGAIVDTSNSYWVTGYIPVNNGDIIICSSKGTNRCAWYSSDKSTSQFVSYSGGGTGITAPLDGFIVITVNVDNYPIDGQFVVTINNSDLTYSPYANICPISGWQGADVYIEPTYDPTATPKASVTFGAQGKNLIDMSEANIVLNKYIDNSGVEKTSDANFYNSVYIPVEPSTKYTLSTSTSVSYVSFMEYDAQKSFIKRTLLSNFGTSGSVTTDTATAYILVGSNPDGTKMTYEKVAAINWMLNKGDASAYEPYRDYILGGTADLVAGTGSEGYASEIITKDSAWYAFSTGTGNSSAVVRLANYDNVKYVTGNASYNGAICSIGPELPNYWTGGRPNETCKDMGFAYSSTGQLRIHRSDVTNITDLDSFKAALPDIQIVYLLATPTPYTFPPASEQLTLAKGTNTIWADTNGTDISVTYVTKK